MASGLSAKQYAEGQGISVQALYQARKRLRTKGVLGARKSATRGGSARFSKVAVTPVAGIEPPRFRIELANGAVLEWSGAASLEPFGGSMGRPRRATGSP